MAGALFAPVFFAAGLIRLSLLRTSQPGRLRVQEFFEGRSRGELDRLRRGNLDRLARAGVAPRAFLAVATGKRSEIGPRHLVSAAHSGLHRVEESIKDAIDKISEEIVSAGGKVETVQKMEKKNFVRVANKKHNAGFYVNVIFESQPSALEHRESIGRIMTVAQLQQAMELAAQWASSHPAGATVLTSVNDDHQ